MEKRTFIRRAYKAIGNLTSKKYKDDCWDGVKGIVCAILDNIKEVTLYLEGSKYEGTLGEEGFRKVYRYTVTGLDRDADMLVVASFCGTVSDPMSAYDLTVLLN